MSDRDWSGDIDISDQSELMSGLERDLMEDPGSLSTLKQDLGRSRPEDTYNKRSNNMYVKEEMMDTSSPVMQTTPSVPWLIRQQTREDVSHAIVISTSVSIDHDIDVDQRK